MTDEEKLRLIEISMMELAPLYGAIKAAASSIKDVGSLALTETVSKLEEAAKLVDAADDDIVDVTYDVEIDEEALRERGEFKLKTQESLKEAYDDNRITADIMGASGLFSNVECYFSNVPVVVSPKGSHVPWDCAEMKTDYTIDVIDLFTCTHDLEYEYIDALLAKRGITKDSSNYQDMFDEVLSNEVYDDEYDRDLLEEVIERLMNDETDKDLYDYVAELAQYQAQQEIDEYDPQNGDPDKYDDGYDD